MNPDITTPADKSSDEGRLTCTCDVAPPTMCPVHAKYQVTFPQAEAAFGVGDDDPPPSLRQQLAEKDREIERLKRDAEGMDNLYTDTRNAFLKTITERDTLKVERDTALLAQQQAEERLAAATQKIEDAADAYAETQPSTLHRLNAIASVFGWQTSSINSDPELDDLKERLALAEKERDEARHEAERIKVQLHLNDISATIKQTAAAIEIRLNYNGTLEAREANCRMLELALQPQAAPGDGEAGR